VHTSRVLSRNARSSAGSDVALPAFLLLETLASDRLPGGTTAYGYGWQRNAYGVLSERHELTVLPGVLAPLLDLLSVNATDTDFAALGERVIARRRKDCQFAMAISPAAPALKPQAPATACSRGAGG
jgi:hypothetical protein